MHKIKYVGLLRKPIVLNYRYQNIFKKTISGRVTHAFFVLLQSVIRSGVRRKNNHNFKL